MKRFLNYYLSMTLIASLFVMAGCGEDEEDVPVVGSPVVSIEGTAAGQETAAIVDEGEEVSFTVDVVAPAGFNTFFVNKTVGDETVEIFREARAPGATAEAFTYEFDYTPATAEAGQDVIFDFVAVDDNAKEGSATYTITVNEQQVNVFPAKLLYAPAADGSTKSFFSAETGETYSSDDVTGTAEAVSPLIDFGYFYGATNNATIASPANFPFEVGQADWSTRNETKIKKTTLDVSAFEESNTSASINAAFDDAEFGTNQQQAIQLAVGDVLAFETDPDKEGGSKRGLILVEAIDPGTANNDFIQIKVKVIE